MGRTESKAIVISSGNIPPFHIFLLPPKCYTVPDTRPRFRLLFQALSRLRFSTSTREASVKQIYGIT